MKVGLITYHNAVNYGAVLQAYALCKTIKKTGSECTIIDYRTSETKHGYKSVYTRPESVKDAIIQLISIINYFKLKKKYKNFQDFQDKYLPLTGMVFKSYQELCLAELPFDAYICGSDQIWRPKKGKLDYSYFLGFVKKGSAKKISYAPSFGIENIPAELSGEIKSLLADFHQISVRENQGSEILKRIIDTDIKVVLDPTMLLTREEWESISNGPLIDTPYILVYCLDHSDVFFNMLAFLKKVTGLKVVIVSGLRFNFIKDVDEVVYGGPCEFLNLIRNAEFIFTNSFHGLIFSAIFNKPFYTVRHRTANSRIDNFLKLLNCQDRQIETTQGLIKNMYSINYDEINKLIDAEREKSLAYLYDALSQQ